MMNPKTNPPSWLNWDDITIKQNESIARKYNYVYGIKDIGLTYKEFTDASVYVSSPFEIDGNAIEVSLEVNEYNPKINTMNTSINPYDTSIEYYISFKEYPTVDDWMPILPKGQRKIENELLLFKSSPRCRLRFPCDTTKEISVYRNGVKLNKQYWSFGSNNSITIDKKFDKYAVYTVSYFPNIDLYSPWDIELPKKDREVVKFISPDGTEGEVFANGTNRNGAVTLSKYPYIDYERINAMDSTYKPIEVVLEEANIAGPNRIVYNYIDSSTTQVKTKNITDYRNLTEPYLKPYDFSFDAAGNMINPFFEYYQDGRKLYFTETFNNSHIISNMETNHGDAIIRVKYSYLRTKIRFKIILRNTSHSDNAITPVVKDYSLIFKAVR